MGVTVTRDKHNHTAAKRGARSNRTAIVGCEFGSLSRLDAEGVTRDRGPESSRRLHRRALTEEIAVADLTSDLGTTEYHVRRMFSSLAGIPLSEYIRRRRMTVAAADVLGDRDLLGTAVRFGYGSTEAFNRVFRAVHGVSPGEARRNGGPLCTQPQLRFP